MVRPLLTKRARFQRLWRQAACFALLVLVARAVIPAGYMPAVPAQAATGILWLSLCGADSRLLQAVAIASMDDTEAPRPAAAEVCPFGLLAGAAGGPLPAALEPGPWPAATAPAVPLRLHLPPTQRLLGPPLGSRAPPAA
ncbi:MAG: DUF2946 family protein [Pigmentiphaga sp.]